MSRTEGLIPLLQKVPRNLSAAYLPWHNVPQPKSGAWFSANSGRLVPPGEKSVNGTSLRALAPRSTAAGPLLAAGTLDGRSFTDRTELLLPSSRRMGKVSFLHWCDLTASLLFFSQPSKGTVWFWWREEGKKPVSTSCSAGQNPGRDPSRSLDPAGS